MIDTIDIVYDFEDIDNYNHYYAVIDKIAKQIAENNKGLYPQKDKSDKIIKNHYVTYTFAFCGFCEIKFIKQIKYKRYTMKIRLKPIRLIYINSNVRLSNSSDYCEIEENFNTLISSINQMAKTSLLPFFCKLECTKDRLRRGFMDAICE